MAAASSRNSWQRRRGACCSCRLGDSFLSSFADTAAGHPEWCTPTADQVTQDWVTTCSALKIYDRAECGSFVGGLNEISLISFGPQTAQALDADFQVVSCCGAGLVGYAYSENIDPRLTRAQYEELRPSNQLMFNRSVFTWPNATYDVQSWVPQVVMIDSGTNDWNANTTDYDQASWVQQAAGFLQQIDEAFSGPVIIISVFPLSRASGEGFLEGPNYQDAMEALYQEGRSRGLSNLNLLKIGNLSNAAVADWCLHHPSALAHAEIAAHMTALVSQLTGWPQANAIAAPPAAVFRPSTAFYTGGANNLMSVPAPSGLVPLVPLGFPGLAPMAGPAYGPALARGPSQDMPPPTPFATSPLPPPPPAGQTGAGSSPPINPGSGYEGYVMSPPPLGGGSFWDSIGSFGRR